MSGNFFFRKSCGYEIMWKKCVEPETPQMTKKLMRVACCIPKAKNTYPEYVILIAFPLQQLLHECSSVLRYTYICSFRITPCALI
jgi:hypothetical protein